MNKIIPIILSALLLPYIIQSCTYNNEIDLYSCDTTNVSYSKDIEPIIRNNCYRCHGNGNSEVFGKGNNLEGYDSLKIYSGLLVGSIKHSPGFIAMPKGVAKLSNCDIGKIEKWVNEGVPDN
jgi:hypothetical protein